MDTNADRISELMRRYACGEDGAVAAASRDRALREPIGGMNGVFVRAY